GSGAMYQAVFWPEHEDKTNPTPNKVNWVGDVRSLLLDATGRMYEDTVQDGTLNTAEDREIVFYYSGNVKQTRGCYDTVGYRQGPDGIEGTADDFQCRGDLDPEREPCLGNSENPICSWKPECESGDPCVETMDVKYLWSANRQLREMDVLADRKIYTWNDVDNNGMVDPDKGEWFQLKTFDPTDTNNYWSTLNAAAATAANRGKVTEDFLTPDDWANFVGLDPNKTPDEMELDAIQSLTRWLLGVDQTDVDDPETDWIDRPLRSRQYFFADTGKTQEWRLGDVIHSAPTAVSKPAEAFNQIYRDPTYTKFSKYWDKRRIVIYFGGNDGMLHAVNGGFYIEDTKQFCCTKPVTVTKTVDGQDVEVEECNDPVTDGECTGTTNLGEELWAYIPYNLQPHLKCLADEYYSHKYFVDKKPRIFDVQIFAEDADHPGGWGTILVGGMRFGGATVDAKDLNDFKDNNGLEDPRQFTSSFFILDITNPDSPQLLGELTRNTDDDYVDLNFTTSTPAMVSMRDGGKDAVTSTWYLVMGNGPTSMDGTNAKDEQGRLAILPLEWLKGPIADINWTDGIPNSNTHGDKEPIRIYNELPGVKNEGGVYPVPLADNSENSSYISDIISVDYNIDASTEDSLGVRFRTDAVYFGTVDGTWHPEYPNDYYVKSGDQRFWNGGGRLFRLVTKVLDASGDEKSTTPTEWADEWADGNPVRMLADLGAPVVSAPSVGYDGYNYWIYAGTGRFYDELDKTDDGRCLPVNPACLEPQACATSACTSDPACTGTCSDRSNMAYFGIKEPIIDDKNEPAGWSLTSANKVSSFGCDDAVMTWGLIESNLDVSPYITNGLVGANPPNQSLSPDKPSGQRGLMQTDNILVGNKSGYLACWHCRMEGSEYICDNLSDEKCYRGVPAYPVLSLTEDPDSNGPIYDYDKDRYSFEKLTGYIAGTGCEDVNGDRITTGLDGWYHIFHDPRERNISTASLLGDMLYFTSYQPLMISARLKGRVSFTDSIIRPELHRLTT
ncbi:type IV pilus assembly protein PilY1, partial [Candidatus Electrothrix communis]